MKRTNTFEVRPRTHRQRVLFLEVLDASAACYNEVNYDRRQAFFDARSDDHTDDPVSVSELRQTVKAALTQEEYRKRYIQTLGSAAPQQLVQKNWDAWTSFFALLRAYRDPTDRSVTDEPSPPGYWKDGDRRRLQTVVRNDQYTLSVGERSRLEIPAGMQLKETYGLGYNERLRLEVCGRPHWNGPPGRLELVYDRDAESFTAHQTVGTHDNPPRRRDRSHSLATTDGEDRVVAAVDIGANNLAAVTTSEGDHLLFHGRSVFERFHAHTEEIARLQRDLEDGEWSSRRIRTRYRVRGEQRDHAQDALVRQLAEWLASRGVSELLVGELDDVRETHRSATANEKTDLFWAHGRFRTRLRDVLEDEYGIPVVEESEAGTSSRCPRCRSEDVHRAGDHLQCMGCDLESHADVAASMNFLVENADVDIDFDVEGRPMARPAASRENTTEEGHHVVPCLEWDDHRWRRRDHPSETNEAPVNRSTREGNLAAVGAGLT